MHSVLFLIMAFFLSSGLFVMLGAEFVAMILVIVYVGAVAVLFLFVVMMLDMDFAHLRKGAMQYIPLGLLLGGVLLAQLVMVYQGWSLSPIQDEAKKTPTDITNSDALGQVIYTDYIYIFQGAGLVLLVAMIGAIVLTLRVRPGVKRQNVSKQQDVKVSDVLEIKKVTPGTGV